ncbi:MAG: LemA family protein [Clostridia bacterium]
MMIALIIAGIIIVLIIAFISLYNHLVQLKMRVKNAWAQIDTQLKRRFDLIPNLIETVKGYMVHEESTLKELVDARNNFANANTMEGKADANKALSGNLKSLFAIAEAYPDLKANQNFSELQTELASTEDKVAYSRQFYNDTVQMYNTAIMTFPGNVFANMFKFTEEKFFEITNTDERENVKVKF